MGLRVNRARAGESCLLLGRKLDLNLAGDYSLDHLGFLEEPLQQLDKQIVAQIEARGYTGPWLLWQTVPGSKKPAPSVY